MSRDNCYPRLCLKDEAVGRSGSHRVGFATKATLLLLLGLLGLADSNSGRVSAATLPAGFSETIINGPAGANWNECVGITFEDNGRMYVWERAGKVWIKEYGASNWSLLLDIGEEVGGWRDFGLLGFALDPNFRVNGYVYLMYVVDRHYLMNYGTPNYNPASNEYFAATIGRITRYTARASAGFKSVDYTSRLVLLGETKNTGFPILYQSHGVGSLVFGTDGTLLAPETYYAQALSDGILKPKENVGAYRAQLVDSLSGKVVRIDPATGDGIASNPFYDPANPRAARSRVWALGLRNPYRMTLRPESGSHLRSDGNPGVLYIGDVGYDAWEELNVCTSPGQNFGWPAFEGIDPKSGYFNANVENLDAPNPLYPGSGCSRYFYFHDLIKQNTSVTANKPPFNNPCNSTQKIPSGIPQFLHTPPATDWKHGTTLARTWIYNGSGVATAINVGAAGSPVSGSMFPGNCSIGGAWYTGSDFPGQYKNTYFHAELGANWIRDFVFDANDKPVSVTEFLTGGGEIVDVATHPIDGGLYYISWPATMRRISYSSSGNLPPTATASADRNYGPGPLTVQFTGSNSTDPEGLPLVYHWDFGDGTPGSAGANPSHTFNAPAGVPTPYTVTLTVTDNAGQTSTATLIISLNNTPPRVTITSPVDGSKYPMSGDTGYNLRATVTDAESSDGQLGYEWQTILHHNNHEHQEPVDIHHETTTVISPVGCDGNTYYYRIVLKVTDPARLSATNEVRLYPDCQSNAPPAITVWVEDAAPAGAWTGAEGGDGWNWVSGNPTPFSGVRAHQSTLAAGIHYHYFSEASAALPVNAGDALITYVLLDSANLPRELMLQWFDGASWSHAAYWGELPAAGQWMRLEVPANLVGLEGHTLSGMNFVIHGGRATWDYSGKSNASSPPLPDTTQPSVTITAPANNATVSGSSVMVSADAADDVGVVGVQFKLDGANFGAEDTTGPYTITWNTSSTSNGSHTLTALARDAAGNQGVSVPVSVVVSNTGSGTVVWVDDAVPAGAWTGADGGDRWQWVSSNPAPYSGARAHQSTLGAGIHYHYFAEASATLSVNAGEMLVTYVLLDPANVPRELMLQWFDGASWSHAAYWGENLIPWGTDGTASQRPMGALPAAGQWMRLEVPANLVGLEGHTLSGMNFVLHNGRATWDYSGK
ncbi:MAG: hypothetical protein DME19_04520 [Verrucomicrobia bacterium]|nr:MAG: hypothetical protein DME19_04520 [Verrucomicrobiota bacterium]